MQCLRWWLPSATHQVPYGHSWLTRGLYVACAACSGALSHMKRSGIRHVEINAGEQYCNRQFLLFLLLFSLLFFEVIQLQERNQATGSFFSTRRPSSAPQDYCVLSLHVSMRHVPLGLASNGPWGGRGACIYMPPAILACGSINSVLCGDPVCEGRVVLLMTAYPTALSDCALLLFLVVAVCVCS